MTRTREENAEALAHEAENRARLVAAVGLAQVEQWERFENGEYLDSELAEYDEWRIDRALDDQDKLRSAFATAHLDRREHATVLAALRFWQRCGLEGANRDLVDGLPHAESDIATIGFSEAAMTPEEVDQLCERING